MKPFCTIAKQSDQAPHLHPAPTGTTRRKFLQLAATGTAFTIVPSSLLRSATAPSNKLTIAGIGVGGQGTQNMMALQRLPEVQVVAVCDVNKESSGYISWNWSQGRDTQVCGREPARKAMDQAYAKDKSSGTYRGCRAYTDYRELLEKEDVDGVMIATPDHSHAMITMAAIKRGKHVYCEKPLTWSVSEARLIAEAARKAKVATQLGNQGQSEEKARLVQEMIADGAIGPVREVQSWCPARFWAWPDWDGRPKDTPPVPEGLDWDLWLGPAPVRPYHPCYTPWTWRNWWDFGTGLLGDLGCHKLSTVFKALKLGHPTTVEASTTKLSTETYPLGEMVTFEFPARGEMPPVRLLWCDGGLRMPRPAEVEPDDVIRDILYIGDKGKMIGDKLVPDEKMDQYNRPPKTLPRSPGQFEEWVRACRGGVPAGSDFVQHSGLLTEVVLLGNIASRVNKKLHWDGAAMRFTNDEKANKMLAREYRSGWAL